MRKPTVVMLLLGLLPMSASAEEVREGRWQYTSTMQMEGMPAMPQMPQGMQLPPGVQLPQGMKSLNMGPGGMSSTYESCITKDKLVPQDQARERDCKISDMKRNGNRISWTASCTMPDGGTAESVGEGSYNGDSSQMVVKTKASHQGHAMNMTMNISGKYLGPCR